MSGDNKVRHDTQKRRDEISMPLIKRGARARACSHGLIAVDAWEARVEFGFTRRHHSPPSNEQWTLRRSISFNKAVGETPASSKGCCNEFQ
jgi:hypothetical protein